MLFERGMGRGEACCSSGCTSIFEADAIAVQSPMAFSPFSVVERIFNSQTAFDLVELLADDRRGLAARRHRSIDLSSSVVKLLHGRDS